MSCLWHRGGAWGANQDMPRSSLSGALKLASKMRGWMKISCPRTFTVMKTVGFPVR
jgi:hypothetical protein